MWRLAVFLAASSILLAQNPAPRFRIGLDIIASDDLKSSIQSYLGRELRALGDVEVIDSYNFFSAVAAEMKHRPIAYALKVLAVKTSTTGFAMSVVYLQRYNNVPVMEFIKGLGEEQYKQYSKVILENGQGDIRGGGEIYLDMSIYTGGDENQLKSYCAKAVAAFDTDVLNPKRKQKD